MPVPGSPGDVVSRASFEMEKAIIATIAEGKGAATPGMDKVPEQQLKGLTPGQSEATRLILESDDQFIAIQGYAGVGKTTQFKAVLSAIDTLPAEQRPTVVGIGPTHRAVHEMQSIGVKAQTLASFLSESRQQAMAGETPDYRNTLFLVDESSMIGNRDMAEFNQRVAQRGQGGQQRRHRPAQGHIIGCPVQADARAQRHRRRGDERDCPPTPRAQTRHLQPYRGQLGPLTGRA